MIVSGSDASGLQGVTLKVYLYVVKKHGPVGPRDVMRGVRLSSPSVATGIFKNLKPWIC